MPTASAPAARASSALAPAGANTATRTRLAGAGRQHGRTAHLLVGLLGVHAETHGHVDGLDELGLAVVLDDLERLVDRVRLARLDRGLDGLLIAWSCAMS